jgi:hypothetical protein
MHGIEMAIKFFAATALSSSVSRTRVYDIEITATDVAGNMGKAKCSVAVVPENHDGSEDGSEVESLTGKKSKSKNEESTTRVRRPFLGHDPNDLRKQ